MYKWEVGIGNTWYSMCELKALYSIFMHVKATY